MFRMLLAPLAILRQFKLVFIELHVLSLIVIEPLAGGTAKPYEIVRKFRLRHRE